MTILFFIYKQKTFNFIFGLDIEPQRLKIDMKLLEDHLIERHLPMEQRELQTVAQNVIQNLINTERKFDQNFFFLCVIFIWF
jgi:hypothetical protein